MNTLTHTDALGRDIAAAVRANPDINALIEQWAELTKDHPYPAALLDTGMVYLAVNGSYARNFALSPSALVGKEYSTIHRDTDDILLLLKAVSLGERFVFPLFSPAKQGDSEGYRSWSLTPLQDAESNNRGLLVEYFLNDPEV